MKIFRGKSINAVYKKLIKSLLKIKTEYNTKEIQNCCLIIDNPSLTNICFPFRKNISLKYSDAELKWYWKASNSCKEIGKSAKMWLALSDDGETNNSAYGYILIKKYGFNQIEQIIELLKKDTSTRRAVLNISDPAINRITTHDMQCTIGIQFLIRNNGLEETVYMRSNDVYFGLPYDYIYFMTLGEYIASQLGIKLSKYIHNATSMHLYIKDIENKNFDLKYKSPNVFSVDYKHYLELYEKVKYEK